MHHTKLIKETIFGEQITDHTVCLIVNMWNALPLLSLRSFWQAAFQVEQIAVDGVATGDLQVRAHAEYTQMRTADRLMYTNTAMHSRMINMYKSKKRKQVVRGTRVNHIIKNRQDKETHAHMLYAHIARYC